MTEKPFNCCKYCWLYKAKECNCKLKKKNQSASSVNK